MQPRHRPPSIWRDGGPGEGSGLSIPTLTGHWMQLPLEARCDLPAVARAHGQGGGLGGTLGIHSNNDHSSHRAVTHTLTESHNHLQMYLYYLPFTGN